MVAYHDISSRPAIGRMPLRWKRCRKDSCRCYWDWGRGERLGLIKKGWIGCGIFSLELKRLGDDLLEVHEIMSGRGMVSLFSRIDESKTGGYRFKIREEKM